MTKQALLAEHRHSMEIKHPKALEAELLPAWKGVHRSLDQIHEGNGDSQDHEEEDEPTLSQNSSIENSTKY